MTSVFKKKYKTANIFSRDNFIKGDYLLLSTLLDSKGEILKISIDKTSEQLNITHSLFYKETVT